jgi:hypothetical protein
VDVQALNVSARLALLSDGTTVPITDLFDAGGANTENPAEAVGFVCGAGGFWICDLISSFDAVTVQ